MKNILVIGAGLSASSLIKYLLENAKRNDWKVTVGDLSYDLAAKKVSGHPYGEALLFDITNDEQRRNRIEKSDIVISMLPVHLHMVVAEDCIGLKKDLVAPSYVSPEMKRLDRKARDAGVLLMNEIGLDPGLDHMSAMRTIDMIREKGGDLFSFRSLCGGLVAPEFDNNPWNYKFTWNPINIIHAGNGTARFLEDGEQKHIPYEQLFEEIALTSINGYGDFEGYANRDSLKYIDLYGIEEVSTLFRGTLRRPGFCRSWNVFVQLGLTDDSSNIKDSQNMTYRQFIASFLSQSESVETTFCQAAGIKANSPEMGKFEWLGLFEDTKIGLENATPAQILQHLLEKKWNLDSGDRDMIVMQHEFDYSLDGQTSRITSSLVVIGGEQPYTAMSDTVGLPLGVVVKLILNGLINEKGVHIPISKEIYEPTLNELEQFGIRFEEKEIALD